MRPGSEGTSSRAELSFDHVFEPGEQPRGQAATAADDDTEVEAAYTALLLHGTGANQHDLVPLGRALAPGQPLLSPLGKVREQGMPRWFRRIEEGVFDEEDIRQRAAELADFLDEAASAYDLGPKGYLAIGFSNGANIASSLLLLHPGALRGAILIRAMTPLVPDELPDLTGVPVYIASGRRDPLISEEDANQLASMLDEAGAEVTHRWSEGGHELGREELGPIKAWLEDHEHALSTPGEEAIG